MKRRMYQWIIAAALLLPGAVIAASPVAPPSPGTAAIHVCVGEMKVLAGALEMYALDWQLSEAQLLELVSKPMADVQAIFVRGGYLLRPTSCRLRFDVTLVYGKRGGVEVRIARADAAID